MRVQGLAYAIGDSTLWQDVAFDLQEGMSLGLSGPTGSGKTSLLRILAGLETASRGDIRFAGKPQSAWWMPDYRAHVMYLPQRPALPEGTVQTVLTAPFRLRVHRGQHYSAKVVQSYLDALQLPSAFLGKRAEELSGGESQLAALLRTLLLEPVILLLDEPTASLDATYVGRVEQLLIQWRRAGTRASLWVSHDRAQLARVCDATVTLGR